jgi:hypothetical protein
MARYFGGPVHKTLRPQLRRMYEDSERTWRGAFGRVVVVQQPGLHELTNSRLNRRDEMTRMIVE